MMEPNAPTDAPRETSAPQFQHVTHCFISAWQKGLLHTAPQRTWLRQQFTQHPEATNETYFQHLFFTLRMAGRLLLVGVVLILHGLFPFLFTRTASQHLDTIWQIMKNRMKPATVESTPSNTGDVV